MNKSQALHYFNVKELFIDDLIMFDLEGRSLLSLNAIKIIRELKQEFKSGV